MCCLMLALAAAVTFLVISDLTGSMAAGLAGAFVEVALYPRLYSYPKILVPAVALLLIQRYVRRPGRVPLVLMAIWTAVAVLLRHDLGVYARRRRLRRGAHMDALGESSRARAGGRLVCGCRDRRR